jgi:hypothetical protein
LRWVSLTAGAALIVLAFGAATRVADTREGLIAEVITLFAGLAGVSLIIYGLVAYARPSRPAEEVAPPAVGTPTSQSESVPSANQLLIGAGGLALAAVLLSGLALSGDILWAGLGLVLLFPMVAGSAYLCIRFLRAPERVWRLDIKRPKSRKES